MCGRSHRADDRADRCGSISRRSEKYVKETYGFNLINFLTAASGD
jgi:hypothetical protein